MLVIFKFVVVVIMVVAVLIIVMFFIFGVAVTVLHTLGYLFRHGRYKVCQGDGCHIGQFI